MFIVCWRQNCDEEKLVNGTVALTHFPLPRLRLKIPNSLKTIWILSDTIDTFYPLFSDIYQIKSQKLCNKYATKSAFNSRKSLISSNPNNVPSDWLINSRHTKYGWYNQMIDRFSLFWYEKKSRKCLKIPLHSTFCFTNMHFYCQ